MRVPKDSAAQVARAINGVQGHAHRSALAPICAFLTFYPLGNVLNLIDLLARGLFSLDWYPWRTLNGSSRRRVRTVNTP